MLSTVNTMSSISLMRIKEYIEKTTDEKLLEMRITRKDLETILTHLTELIKKMSEIAGVVGTINKNQIRALGNLTGLKSYLDTISEKIGSEATSIKTLINKKSDESKAEFNKIDTRLDQGLARIDNIIEMLKSLSGLETKTSEKIDSLINQTNTINRAIDELHKFQSQKLDSISSTLNSAIFGLKDIAKILVEARRFINDIQQTIGTISRKSEQIIGQTTYLKQGINKLSGDLQGIGSAIERIDRSINNQNELLKKMLDELTKVKDILEFIRGFESLLNTILTKLDATLEKYDDLSNKVDLILRQLGQPQSGETS